MLVKCTAIEDGPGPSETTVAVLTVDGVREEVVLSKRSLQGNAMQVGAALHHEAGRYLVELPREAASGRWRVWIPESEVSSDEELHAAE